jgi:LysR family transcriptional regulator, nitrogen assimilation regulatory protein
MELKQLRHFLAVSELGSFSTAAVFLSVAQPVLSRQVRSLEDELGLELLYRNGRGIVPTKAGEVLNSYAKQIVDLTDRASCEVSAMRAAPRGQAVIGVPPTIGTVLTVPLVQRFKREFPNVSLQVIEGYSGYVREWLATGRVDVAVLYNAPKTSTLQTEPLIQEELFLVGPPSDPLGFGDGPVAAEALGRIPCILPSPRHGMRALVDSTLKLASLHANVVYEIDALNPVLSLIEQGAGFTILPLASVHRQVQAGQLAYWPIVEPRLTRQMVLATSRRRPTTITTRALAKMTRQLVKDLVAQGLWTPRTTPVEAVAS